MLLTINDRVSHKVATSREYTDEGFLRVPGRVARTGIQEYLARELDMPGDPNRIIRVYRPPGEVFNDVSLSTFDGAVITIDHPSGLVTSKNYKKVAVGVVRGIGRQDGDYVQCDLIIQDADAIAAINSGKCELSSGYTAVYDDAPGVTPDGEPYHYIQRDIKINHVAAVYNARAGTQARVFDKNHTGGNTMPVLITTDSGRSVDVADPANAQVVADAFDRLLKRATTAEDSVQRIQAVADGAKEELAKAVLLSNDAAIAERVALIAKTGATARKIAGDSFKCESVDSTAIMRAALNSKFPTIDWAAKSDLYVQARFDMADEAMPEETEEEKKARMEKEAKESSDSGASLLAQLALLSKDGASIKIPVVDSAPPISRAQAALNARTGKVKA